MAEHKKRIELANFIVVVIIILSIIVVVVVFVRCAGSQIRSIVRSFTCSFVRSFAGSLVSSLARQFAYPAHALLASLCTSSSLLGPSKPANSARWRRGKARVLLRFRLNLRVFNAAVAAFCCRCPHTS